MRRLLLGMSQTKLADAVDITFQQVQKYENGTNRVSASTMQEFANILNVPVSFFFEGAPEIRVTGNGKVSKKAATTPAYVTTFLSRREGHAIMKAFAQISDRTVWGRLVALAKELAGNGGSLKSIKGGPRR